MLINIIFGNMKIFLFLLLTTAMWAQKTSTGLVTRVKDGDTYVIQANSFRGSPQIITVRLANVDCPELAFIPKRKPAQEYGMNAADSVRNLIGGKNVELTYYGYDFFGRVIVFVRIGGNRLDDIILSRGWGWYYKGYHSGKAYKEGKKKMERARAAKLGLWANPDPVEPWIYRK